MRKDNNRKIWLLIPFVVITFFAVFFATVAPDFFANDVPFLDDIIPADTIATDPSLSDKVAYAWKTGGGSSAYDLGYIDLASSTLSFTPSASTLSWDDDENFSVSPSYTSNGFNFSTSSTRNNHQITFAINFLIPSVARTSTKKTKRNANL